MAFATEWESLYSAQRHNSVWPWSDLVSLFSRYYVSGHDGGRLLEVGCGQVLTFLFPVSWGGLLGC